MLRGTQMFSFVFTIRPADNIKPKLKLNICTEVEPIICFNAVTVRQAHRLIYLTRSIFILPTSQNRHSSIDRL